jgi:hypothetical protein
MVAEGSCAPLAYKQLARRGVAGDTVPFALIPL